MRKPGRIFVVNKYVFDKDQSEVRKNSLLLYIGRPKLLGNEWDWRKGSSAKYRAKDREDSIIKYRKWIKSKIKKRPNPVFYIMRDIYYALKKGIDVYLICFCKPKPCHGDVIKEILEIRLSKYLNKTTTKK